MLGSCVWNPGDKQARPTSCIVALTGNLELKGAGIFVVVFRSSFRGRCRALVFAGGEAGGSFFTTIFGFAVLRVLRDDIADEDSCVPFKYVLGDRPPSGGEWLYDEIG